MTDQPEVPSDTSKGNIAPLEQPSDALKMTDMSRSNDAEAPTSNPPPSDTQKPQPSATNAPPGPGVAAASSTSPSQPRYQASTSDKGKGPENPPTPPAKNNEPQGTAKNDQPHDTAIGDATDDVPVAPSARADGKPVCAMTLLVPSGRKHPYRIDEKYLTRHNVEIPGNTESGHKDPFSISGYTLKQQILRGWRSDWEPAPLSADKIRLIHLGHIMKDNTPLNNYLKPGAWNVVHLTVIPPDITEEEEPKGGGGKGGTPGSGNSRDNASRCCVIL